MPAMFKMERPAAIGDDSHREGTDTLAYGTASHAEGINSQSNGLATHAEGEGTTANGRASHAEGFYTESSGYFAHSEGYRSKAEARASHAEGEWTFVIGKAGHAEGFGASAIGDNSHAEGHNNIVYGTGAHAEGLGHTAQQEIRRYNIEFEFLYTKDGDMNDTAGVPCVGVEFRNQGDTVLFAGIALTNGKANLKLPFGIYDIKIYNAAGSEVWNTPYAPFTKTVISPVIADYLNPGITIDQPKYKFIVYDRESHAI